MAATFDTLSSIKKFMPLAGLPTRFMFGKVIFNNDPLILCRIKVSIPELIPWDDKEKLPWIYPWLDPGIRGPLQYSFKIPVISSYVMCFYPHDSIYHGFYII